MDERGFHKRQANKVEASMKALPILLFGSSVMAGFLFPPATNAADGPLCDGVFHWVYVTGTENLDGSETGFEYFCQPNFSSGPLLLYLQGAAACFTGDGCDCQPNSAGVCTNPNATTVYGFFNQSTSDDGLPWAQTYWGGWRRGGKPANNGHARAASSGLCRADLSIQSELEHHLYSSCHRRRPHG